MSHDNVETVTRIIASFNAGDVGAAAELFLPDAEWRDLSHAPDTPEMLVGVEAILAVAELWAQAFDEFGAEVYEYIDAHPWVICDTRWYGTGRGSAVGVEIRQADAYELKGGKVARAVLAYPDTATALSAAGRVAPKNQRL
jgi:ketosteroid isomerase-like protein